MNPRYLHRKRIETTAQSLLTEYGAANGLVADPPISVEEILERHLKLSLAFEDLSQVLGRTDVLGATWADTCEVSVDKSLDPDAHPESEGRFRFTLGHEIGHWLLHVPHLKGTPDAAAPQLHATAPQPARRRRDTLEWQADYFAGCLLMPKGMVLREWTDVTRGERFIGFDAINEMARRFVVSEQAMRIRLEQLSVVEPPGSRGAG